jgi:prepilin-type N-terminal cleavage/methylation domain-containing protein
VTSRRQREREQPVRVPAGGFTLIEVMVVLLIVGIIMTLGVRGFSVVSKGNLREGSAHLAGAIRFLFNRASVTGKHHRLVIDLSEGRYWAEVSDDKFYAPNQAESEADKQKREAKEDAADEEARKKLERKQLLYGGSSSSGSSSSGSAQAASSFDISKLEVGDFRPKRARFAAFKDLALKPVSLNKKLRIKSVYTPRMTEPVTSGRAYLYFYPLGQTEPAIVTLTDPTGEHVYSLVVHPITGKVRIYNQEVQPNLGVRYDDEGNVVQMKTGRPSRSADSGFTLLEIMVAVAILASTLVVLLSIVTNNVRATNHAKMTTAATFLARTKMVEIEDEILDQGFTDNDESTAGTFRDLGFPQFRFETLIERIELPSDLANKAKDQAGAETKDATDPMSLLTGFMGGMMASFIDPIRIGLQESVRKVTVRVLWDEHGRRDQSFEVVQYLTDPAKLDLSLTGASGAASGTGSTGSGTGSTGSGTGSTGTLAPPPGLGNIFGKH